MLLYLPTRLFWVYTIILISNTGNLHVYSERTVIRNTRVHISPLGLQIEMSVALTEPLFKKKNFIGIPWGIPGYVTRVSGIPG